MLYYGKKSNKGGSKGMARRSNPASDIGKVMGVAAIGGASAIGLDYLMKWISPPNATTGGLKPWQRGTLQVGVGAVAAALLASKYPQVAVAVAAGNIAVGGGYLVTHAQVYMTACPTGQVRNAQGQCAAPPTCTGTQVRNPAGTGCMEPPTCTAPQVLNAGRNACVAPAAGNVQPRRYPAYVNR